MTECNFYIGKRHALYCRRPNGSLSRFGLRLSPGKVEVYDPLLHRWYELPSTVPVRAGGAIEVYVTTSDSIRSDT